MKKSKFSEADRLRPARRRSRDAAIRGKADLARASAEFPKPMLIELLPADCGAHAVIIATRSMPKAHVARQPGDNSCRGVRNVLAHNTAMVHGVIRSIELASLKSLGPTAPFSDPSLPTPYPPIWPRIPTPTFGRTVVFTTSRK